MNIDIERKNNTVIIKPLGEIDLHNSPQLRKTLQEVIKNDTAILLIDLEGVSYMDSSGLATLVEAFQHISKQGKKFALFSLQDTVKNIFSIARLDEIFAIYPSLEKALKELAR